MELKDNENKMTLKFNTFLVLMKDIDYVVRNVFHLHKPSDYLVEIKDDDDDSDKDEDNDEDSTQFVIVDY